MADKVQYSKFCWNGTQDVMLQDFLKFLKDQKHLEFEGAVDDFLGFGKDIDGVTNQDYILRNANPSIIKEWNDNNGGKPDRIFPGTTFVVPNRGLTTELQTKYGSDTFLEQKNFTIFWSDYQKEILEDSSYVAFDSTDRVNSLDILGEGRKQTGCSVLRKNINCQVWVYVRALDTIVDISPWVLEMSTSKGMDVGSFTIQLIPTSQDLVTASTNSYGEVIEHFSLTDVDEFGDWDKNLVRNDWFTKYIQANDIVFLRYEVLKMESGSVRELKSSQANKKFRKSPSDLATGKMWDMIGLVDTNTVQVNFSNTDYQIQLQGRDFMKLFVEDGSYFMPLTFIQGSPDRWFWGGDKESGPYRRNFIEGAYQFLELYEFQRIDSYAGFILNQLVNVGIVPDSLFTPSQKRTELYEVPAEKKQDSKITGVWKIIRAFFDEQLSDRRVVDYSLASPEGTLMDLFNKICQQPFVEFWGDTWGDEFDIIIRQPPFTRSAIEAIYNGGEYITVGSESLLQMSLSYDSRVYGWYRIMPQNSFLGKSEYSSLAFVPIVMLDEFIDRFGNKRCITNDIYLSMKAFNGRGEEGNVNTLSQALINDLLFTIETTMYLPFTRKGRITINGDRRIKAGTFIVLEPTRELFYVNSVENSISFSGNMVDRVTVLTVERGVRLDCIKGESGRKSYFDIVDIEGLRGAMYKGIANQENESPNRATVNKDVFDYFLERKFFD